MGFPVPSSSMLPPYPTINTPSENGQQSPLCPSRHSANSRSAAFSRCFLGHASQLMFPASFLPAVHSLQMDRHCLHKQGMLKGKPLFINQAIKFSCALCNEKRMISQLQATAAKEAQLLIHMFCLFFLNGIKISLSKRETFQKLKELKMLGLEKRRSSEVHCLT